MGNSNQSATNFVKEFRYDSSANGFLTPPSGATFANTAGRLIEAETDAGGRITDEWFSYNARGELTDVYEFTPHSGGYYHTTAAYWPTGSLETLSGIPGVPTINYGANGSGLDGEGRYTQVTAASGTNPVTSVTYSTSSTTNPLGTLTGVTFGSADSDSFTYDPNTGRMATYTFSVNSQTDKGTLTWNTNGTLGKLVIADNITGTSDSQTCNYTYDDLARIGGQNANGYSVDCGSSKWQQLFTYDPFGNITKSGTLSFIPGYSPTQNQFTSIPGRSVSYDGNGNLLTDNLNTYTWDAYGHMSTVNTGSATVTATYDALDRVVEQYNASAYTEILFSPVGKTALMSGATSTKAFVSLPGGGTAIYNSSGLAYYRHSDHLGSSRLTSTQARGMYSSAAYAPFGEQNATSGTADPSFTGQNSDAVPSLYDFTFREHSMSQGRWISPDPAGMGAADSVNPQTWNRYVYVANNPLKFTDPTGLLLKGPGNTCVGDSSGIVCDGGGGDGGGGGGGGGGCDFMDASGNCVSYSIGTINNIPWNWGPGWSNLPFGAGQLLSAEAAWVALVDQTIAEANALAAAKGDPATAACIAKGLQSMFPGSTVASGSSTGEVGGHWNFTVQLQFSSYDAANAFTSAYTASSAGFPPPARFGAGPAIHLENLDGSWGSGDGTYSIGGTAHIDLFNPNPASLGGGGLLGLAGHVGIDGIGGHIVQFFGGNIDPRSCPF